MAVTPLIKPILNKKGIFYTFQSALEDINITLTNSETAVRFSKFALIRIPEFGVPDTQETDNKFQFMAQGESHLIDGINLDQNINLAQSFQSYALNFESLLIGRPQYNREEKLTVSERVFWKWLKESGSIRFRESNILEKNIPVVAVGAAAKGNTFLNFYNLDSTSIDYVTDISIHKKNKYTPLTRIPIQDDKTVFEQYDEVYVIILSWNISNMLKKKLKEINKNIKFLNI